MRGSSGRQIPRIDQLRPAAGTERKKFIDGRMAIYKIKNNCPFCKSNNGSVKKTKNNFPWYFCEDCRRWVESVYIYLD